VNPCFCYRGLIVDVIRQLWDDGFYVNNKWLKMCHEAWFSYWVDYRTCLTMQDVDQQIEELFTEPEVDPPVFTEELEGETPLGGKMRLRAPWSDENAN
jgi:hypothetical protein